MFAKFHRGSIRAVDFGRSNLNLTIHFFAPLNVFNAQQSFSNREMTFNVHGGGFNYTSKYKNNTNHTTTMSVSDACQMVTTEQQPVWIIAVVVVDTRAPSPARSLLRHAIPRVACWSGCLFYWFHLCTCR